MSSNKSFLLELLFDDIDSNHDGFEWSDDDIKAALSRAYDEGFYQGEKHE